MVSPAILDNDKHETSVSFAFEVDFVRDKSDICKIFMLYVILLLLFLHFICPLYHHIQ